MSFEARNPFRLYSIWSCLLAISIDSIFTSYLLTTDCKNSSTNLAYPCQVSLIILKMTLPLSAIPVLSFVFIRSLKPFSYLLLSSFSSFRHWPDFHKTALFFVDLFSISLPFTFTFSFHIGPSKFHIFPQHLPCYQ